ncbi:MULTISPECIES: hypothetical protein [unclassified Meiothermus]|uniref:hypothetical protein n=1 Tax=unclassified Meiothermus TaxID=370471 RepID=UPI000D7CEC28|nr:MULTISPECIES: hypothetical protein [unclassified Meiothermus]PZA06704.1 hypothetical protein DNA98_11975 [Meiothermus sp. Pnk-1]RYM36630.1 hypothetical protein EWH23_08985 [Meiothermus sp. PNK-Is4]
MYVSNNWQALERLSRDRVATLRAEACFRGVSRVACFRGVSRVAEQRQKPPRLSLRRRIARRFREWARKLESEPYWGREGEASYG